MKGRITSYRLWYGEDTDALEKIIEEYLGDGWELFGNPFYANGFFYQAVVQREIES